MHMKMRPHAKLRFPLILSLLHDENCPSLCLPAGMQKTGCPQSDVMVRNCVICSYIHTETQTDRHSLTHSLAEENKDNLGRKMCKYERSYALPKRCVCEVLLKLMIFNVKILTLEFNLCQCKTVRTLGVNYGTRY